MACGLYDAAFATAGVLLGKDAGPAITGITLFAGFASTVFWSLGAALIGTLGWRGLLLLYATLQVVREPADGAAAALPPQDAQPVAVEHAAALMPDQPSHVGVADMSCRLLHRYAGSSHRRSR